MNLLQDVNLKDKRVFLRVDFNVPMKDGEILDTNRIRSALPTIKYLAESRAKVIIGTHCGRPDGKSTPETSIAPIAKVLEKMLNLKVLVADSVINDSIKRQATELKSGQILVLENLRWDPREEANDDSFAKELAGLAEIYVNDAFAVSHRANASVDAITKYLPSYGGLLLQSEVTKLSLLLENPEKPFIMIIGGVKVKDKAGMIEKLANKADFIFLGGGVANTFLKAEGIEIGASVYDESMVAACKKMLEMYGPKIVLPKDYLRETQEDGSFKILDIGEETRRYFSNEIKKAKTILWNGSLGYNEDPRYCEGMRTVAKAMNEVNATTVIAGGDTVGFVMQENLNKNISFLSTGGGAALEYLAGEKLPGVEALK